MVRRIARIRRRDRHDTSRFKFHRKFLVSTSPKSPILLKRAAYNCTIRHYNRFILSDGSPMPLNLHPCHHYRPTTGFRFGRRTFYELRDQIMPGLGCNPYPHKSSMSRTSAIPRARAMFLSPSVRHYSPQARCLTVNSLPIPGLSASNPWRSLASRQKR
jgi:hypothetical protein